MIKYGLEAENIRRLLDLFELVNTGAQEMISKDEEKTCGKKPVEFGDWLQDHLYVFAKQSNVIQ